jgi:hypothetical protein
MKALFSPCGKYRYWLHDRVLMQSGLADKKAAWIMLNPSTAGREIDGVIQDDPTIGRVHGFTFDFGADLFCVANLFALVSTDPKGLLAAEDPVGPDNKRWITRVVNNADVVICAWGAHKMARRRSVEVITQIRNLGKTPMCLGQNKDGSPKHPLYLPKNTHLRELV